VRGDAVDVRSGNLLGKALAAEFTVAEIITHDDQDVGFALDRSGGRGDGNEGEGKCEKTKNAETRFHENLEYEFNLLPKGSVWF
jgi:hypothetical protein